jgi:hypothetical protein
MTPGRKLLIAEQLVEDDCAEFGAVLDVHMMTVCCDGRERGRLDFDRLLRQSGFRLDRVLPTNVPIGIVEGVAV